MDTVFPPLIVGIKSHDVRAHMGFAFAGLAAHLARVVPNTAIMFTCYELVVRVWKKHHMNSSNVD